MHAKKPFQYSKPSFETIFSINIMHSSLLQVRRKVIDVILDSIYFVHWFFSEQECKTMSDIQIKYEEVCHAHKRLENDLNMTKNDKIDVDIQIVEAEVVKLAASLGTT